jgi:hypothetical protein
VNKLERLCGASAGRRLAFWHAFLFAMHRRGE